MAGIAECSGFYFESTKSENFGEYVREGCWAEVVTTVLKCSDVGDLLEIRVVPFWWVPLLFLIGLVSGPVWDALTVLRIEVRYRHAQRLAVTRDRPVVSGVGASPGVERLNSRKVAWSEARSEQRFGQLLARKATTSSPSVQRVPRMPLTAAPPPWVVSETTVSTPSATDSPVGPLIAKRGVRKRNGRQPS